MRLTFSPPAVGAYEAALSFVVNGLWNVEVKVRRISPISPLYLPCTSPYISLVSRLYLPVSPPTSPLHLPCTSPTSPLHLAQVRGEGCELKLELAEPQQQQLSLGAVPVHQQALPVTRTLPLP